MRIFWVFVFFVPILIYCDHASFQLRVGYFLPAAEKMREVFHNGGVEPELEVDGRIYHRLRAWGNFNTFTANAASIGLKDPTAIQIYPLSLGLKYQIQFLHALDLYLGIGPTYSFVEIQDHSPYVQENVSRTSWGVVGKSGLIYRFGPSIFFNFFGDYYYGKISRVSRVGVESSALNVGGLRTGLGIVLAF